MADGVKHDDMYKVVRGQVRVEKGNETAQVGHGAVLNSLGSGQTFGEMSFLDGSLPCANCIAEGDDVQVMKLSKQGMEALLQQDSELRTAFYKQMAITVTQRLQKVSKTTADIREAPRGLAQQENPASSLSAKKLLKIRRRLGIPDTEHMACMTQCMMITPAKRKLHGTLYVFETAVGFVAKVFGLRQQEVVAYSAVSEVLLNAAGPAGEGNTAIPHGTSIDFQDGFYQFLFWQIAVWFGIRMPVQAGDFNVSSVYDDDTQQWVDVTTDTWLWPSFQGCPWAGAGHSPRAIRHSRTAC